MKYILLLVFMAMAFGICFLVDKAVFVIQLRAKNRSRVMPPLRYPFMAAVLTLAGAVSAGYGIWAGKLIYGAAGAVFLAIAVWAVVYYRTTGITYDKEHFTFRRGKLRQTFRFADIRGQRSDVTLRVKCLVLCVENKDVVLYSNMQGYTPFLAQAHESWCRARGLEPETQDWYAPEDTRWFPDQETDEEED